MDDCADALAGAMCVAVEERRVSVLGEELVTTTSAT